MFTVTRSFAGAQDFACGLRRPQNGSSSIPTRSTKHPILQLAFLPVFGLALGLVRDLQIVGGSSAPPHPRGRAPGSLSERPRMLRHTPPLQPGKAAFFSQIWIKNRANGVAQMPARTKAVATLSDIL